jgi:branched-chain amino acid transport system permease protein
LIKSLPDRVKKILLGAGFGVVVLVLCLAVMKVPVGALLQGMFPAVALGLTAVCLVLVYRTVRVINFTQIAMGLISTQLFYELYTRSILPYPAAIFVALLAGIVVGALIGVLSATLFFRHPRLVMTVVTIFMVGIIGYIFGQLQTIFVKPGEVEPIHPILGPFPHAELKITGQPFRLAHLVGLLILAGLSVGLVLFFRWTRIGTAVRASAENADRASLLGINVKLLQVGVWTLVGFIASATAVAVMPVQQYQPGAGVDPTELLLPLAAAVVARMASMPIAFFTAIGLSLLQYSITYSTSLSAWINVGLFFILIFGLLLQRKRIQVRADDSTSWKAMKEVRSTPRELLALRAIRNTRIVLIAIAALVVGFLPWITASDTTQTFSLIWIYAMIGISLVVLTGWTGQISLGQMSFVLIGAFVGGDLTSKMHWPFWIALPVAGLVGALVAVIVGLPALRIRGLFLAATTFSLAIIVPLFIFDPQFLGNSAPKSGVIPPKLFFINFESVRWMYYLCVLIFLAISASVQALRRSRGGRVLIALRDNESGVQSFGINIVRTRLTAFAISGFIAALAGCLYVHMQRGLDIQFFTPLASIQLFIIVVIGGISSIGGAVLGALFFFGGAQLVSPQLLAILTGIVGLIVLMAIPGGLTQIVFGTRDAILRVVAMRQHIIVPSLFADYSPEAWERRLAPLSPPIQSQGLGTLKPEQRYGLTSKILGKATV